MNVHTKLNPEILNTADWAELKETGHTLAACLVPDPENITEKDGMFFYRGTKMLVKDEKFFVESAELQEALCIENNMTLFVPISNQEHGVLGSVVATFLYQVEEAKWTLMFLIESCNHLVTRIQDAELLQKEMIHVGIMKKTYTPVGMWSICETDTKDWHTFREFCNEMSSSLLGITAKKVYEKMTSALGALALLADEDVMVWVSPSKEEARILLEKDGAVGLRILLHGNAPYEITESLVVIDHIVSRQMFWTLYLAADSGKTGNYERPPYADLVEIIQAQNPRDWRLFHNVWDMYHNATDDVVTTEGLYS